MNAIDEGIRKAAVFVAALDCSAADALLDRLPDGQARRVRDAMIALSEVEAGEERRIRDEFMRVRSRGPKPELAGIELDGNLAMLGPAHSPTPRERTETMQQQPSPPFAFLSGAAGGDLADALQNERPQIIAMVLAHLPPRRASEVLERLAPASQAEVIRRLADLEEADPSVVFDVEQAIKSRVAQRWGIRPKRIVGMKAVQGILDASDPGLSQTITKTLAPTGVVNRPRPAACVEPMACTIPIKRVAPTEQAKPSEPEEREEPDVDIPFEALPRLDAISLATLFREAGRQLTGAALLGAPVALINRVLHVLPKGESKWLRRHLDEPGPIRLRDVEEARRRIAQLAAELNRSGRIETTFNQSRMILTA